MDERKRRIGLGFGAILAVAAVAMLMPLPAAGGLRGHSVDANLAKGAGLQQIGRTVTNSLSPQVSAEVTNLGLRNLPADTTVPTSTGPTTVPPASPKLASVQPVTSPQLLGQFSGLTYATAGHILPPDTQVAVNGTYVFELTNDRAKITSLNGSTVYRTFSMQAFFGTASTDNVADVQVYFDQLSKRWVFSADDFTTNYVQIAVSKTSSPTGAYYTYHYQAMIGSLAQSMDQPVLGGSKTRFAWNTNQYNTTTNAFYGTLMVLFDKHKLETGNVSFQVFGWSGYASLHPARQTSLNGTTGADVLYSATTGLGGGSTTLTVIEFKGVVGGLTVRTVTYTIANTGYVPGAIQPGTTALLGTGDARVQSIGWDGGSLWLSFTTACTPSGDLTTRSCVRVDWVYTGTNLFLQDTDTAVAGMYLFYGALAVLPQGGGYLMVVGYSGALAYPSIAMTGQNDTDASGTWRGPIPAFSGSWYDTSNRFGDYSGIQLIPGATKNTAIGASEYDGPSGWATEVVKFSFY